MLFYSSMKGFVHMIYNPVKEISIDMFGKCISGIDGMKFRNWLDVGFGGGCELPMAQPVGHLFVLHTHEVAEDGEGFMLGLIETISLDPETTKSTHAVVQREEPPACRDPATSTNSSFLSSSSFKT